jgi:hypothetical protein
MAASAKYRQRHRNQAAQRRISAHDAVKRQRGGGNIGENQ